MSRRGGVEQAAREERIAAIDGCPRCDASGWRLAPDGTDSDEPRRCTHSDPPAVRDVTAPIHEPGLFLKPPETDERRRS